MDTGCLLIDELLYGEKGLAPFDDLPALGFRAERFSSCGDDLHAALQRAYQRVRRDGDMSAILAFGTGCDAALALAGQLPADRLALLCPRDIREMGGAPRQLRDVRRYARRGAAFCVADVLIVPGPDSGLADRLRRALCNSRVTALSASGFRRPEGKEDWKTAILHFLRHGVLPKSLAENPEMCIIYG